MEGMKQGGPHPTREELVLFMRGQLSRVESRTVVRHLLAGCPRCVAVTRPVWWAGEQVRVTGPFQKETRRVRTGGLSR